jgi:N-acetyl-anhydromuramyl-L-alanine amidase AmpD
MSNERRFRWRMVITFLLVTGVVFLSTPLAAAPAAQAGPDALQTAFAAAAQEFGVPQAVLLSVSYNESRWEHHNGEPSEAGGYGLMHLTDVDASVAGDAKGDEIDRSNRPAPADPSLHTLDAAAALIGQSPETLKQDPAQNIRGGAALLAQYMRDTVGAPRRDEGDWYGAVAKYSGSQEAAVALDFADSVYGTIQQGAERTTTDKQQVRLAAKNVKPNKNTADSLHLRNPKYTGADCPNGLACRVIPAAYQLNDPNDLGDYGNYDLANRPADGLDIRYIVIHDTETPYDATIRYFQNRFAYVSSHYVLRAADGQITQMVDNKNVAWHAGNWYFNGHAIGLEHEGFAIEGPSWYSEQLYRSSARLVRYLAEKYNIPLDRAHIIGHDDIPGPTPFNQTRMHWDPGPYWDWAHYMALIGAPINPSAGDRDSDIVTINPNFNTNTPPLSYCFTATDCRDVPAQSASFVYLRTAPSADAPLLDDPALPGPGTTRAPDWGDKAATGQQFYRVDRQGDWDAIFFGGQKAWFYNPRHNTNTVPGSGTLITPKAGLASIPVYGRAYPEDSAYPGGINPQLIVPLQYTLPAGQIYVAKDLVKSDYFYAPTYTLNAADHIVVEGQTEYYLIFFNHRLAFVKASDVDVVSAP